MRLWSEERKLGTLEWLLTLPLNAWQAVVGKYLAGLAFIGVTLALSFDLPIFLWIYGNPDIGPIIGGYLGVMVMGMVYLAIGSFASSLTGDQIVAFVVAVALSFVVFMISLPQFLEWMKDWFGTAVTSKIELFGILSHFQSISRGVVDSRDIVYAFAVSGIFLFLNYLIVDHRS
jgi:ABC-2 type transport system permease protein